MRDTVAPAVRALVLARDLACVLYKLDKHHVCRDQWHRSHSPYELAKLTVDHVHDGYGMTGKRAPSDAQHLVAMCAGANIAGPSKAVRQAERAYLASLYPEAVPA